MLTMDSFLLQYSTVSCLALLGIQRESSDCVSVVVSKSLDLSILSRSLSFTSPIPSVCGKKICEKQVLANSAADKTNRFVRM
ncbi:hypothetical protein CUMW_167530 [Citrus unshiu]|nr:hypothetical protein CUMW_167530 [Citrus unshiu]